ncbi:unnamed protein product [Arabidopsis lyrata]|nr:unnamed protein product [Arabidopsis lyrata]
MEESRLILWRSVVILVRWIGLCRISDLERFGSKRLNSRCLKVDGEDGVAVLVYASWCGSSSCLFPHGSEQQRLCSRWLSPSLVSPASSLCFVGW